MYSGCEIQILTPQDDWNHYQEIKDVIRSIYYAGGSAFVAIGERGFWILNPLSTQHITHFLETIAEHPLREGKDAWRLWSSGSFQILSQEAGLWWGRFFCGE
jgi:hypothetical protein